MFFGDARANEPLKAAMNEMNEHFSQKNFKTRMECVVISPHVQLRVMVVEWLKGQPCGAVKNWS